MDNTRRNSSVCEAFGDSGKGNMGESRREEHSHKKGCACGWESLGELVGRFKEFLIDAQEKGLQDLDESQRQAIIFSIQKLRDYEERERNFEEVRKRKFGDFQDEILNLIRELDKKI